MTNLELQELLNQYPDDADLIVQIDYETNELRLDYVSSDRHPERNELTLTMHCKDLFEND